YKPPMQIAAEITPMPKTLRRNHPHFLSFANIITAHYFPKANYERRYRNKTEKYGLETPKKDFSKRRFIFLDMQ
ncbi:hypothetical protein, partial [Shewanella xiamenensis]|uniref:hypothetical protein n=1 Tax=Shewanella xiamenensis TaxID=332186 RepID=UPI0024A694CB